MSLCCRWSFNRAPELLLRLSLHTNEHKHKHTKATALFYLEEHFPLVLLLHLMLDFKVLLQTQKNKITGSFFLSFLYLSAYAVLKKFSFSVLSEHIGEVLEGVFLLKNKCFGKKKKRKPESFNTIIIMICHC